MIRKIEKNVAGRDFVIGDIHGCYDELMLLLEHVEFDHEIDRLISTGDLVDRGPKNIEVLDFFMAHYNKSTFVVKGNHDEMLEMFVFSTSLTDYEYHFDPRVYMYNGGSWTAEFRDPLKSGDFQYSHSQLIKYANFIESLPYILAVGAEKERYNVVHTDFVIKNPVKKKRLGFYGEYFAHDFDTPYDEPLTNDKIDTWFEDTRDHVYWMSDDSFTFKRTLLKPSFYIKQHQNDDLTTIYSGHNGLTTGKPAKFGKQIILDTSAVYEYCSGKSPQNCLSMIEHNSGVVYSARKDTGVFINHVDNNLVYEFMKK